MKVLLIVLGSLFGLMLLAIVGIALMLPMLGKKLDADSHDPAARAKTLAKIADFRVPKGYRVESASDIGISQTATLVPEAAGTAGAMRIQLSSQHYTSGNAQDALDAMGSGLGLTAKLLRCDLKRGSDDAVRVGGKPVALRSYGCANANAGTHFEVGIVPAKASTVQIVATSLNGMFDKRAVDALVASIR